MSASGSDLLVVHRRKISAAAGVFDRDGADVPLAINIDLGVFVQIARLGHRHVPKFNVKRIGVAEVPDFHDRIMLT